ncbi:MAG: hypothetical protein HY291_11360 [Planctomycetes bacterium]|nr:hypothetical protein [Planctomycetota bacterium]
MYAVAADPRAPELQQGRWLMVIVASAFVHVLFLILVGLPQVELPDQQAQAAPIQIDFSADALPDLPADPKLAAVPPGAAVPNAPMPAQIPSAGQTPPPEAKRIPEAETKPQETAKAPDLPKIKIDDLPAEMPKGMIAYDLAKGQEKPPENAQFLGDVNTAAADRAEKNKPIGAPSMQGESKEVAFAGGRRGEDETKVNEPPDPLTGTAQKEGSPDVGKPLETNNGRDLRNGKEEAERKATLEGPEKKEPPALSPFDGSGKPNDRTTSPQDVGKPVLPQEKIGEIKPGNIGLPEGQDKGGAEQGPAKILKQEDASAPKSGDKRAEKNPLPFITENAQDLHAQSSHTLPVPAPENSGKPVPSKDPERSRVEDLLNGIERAAPENAQTQTGTGSRKGQAGVEGDGRTHSGHRNAVSDVLSDNDATVAASTGDVAFAKAASPEAAYLKEYLARTNAAWKRNIVASGRTRLEFGAVVMRFTLGKDGKLLEAVEVKREGDISDQNVADCKRALQQAAPHDAFPPSLAGKEKLAITIGFLYR